MSNHTLNIAIYEVYQQVQTPLLVLISKIYNTKINTLQVCSEIELDNLVTEMRVDAILVPVPTDFNQSPSIQTFFSRYSSIPIIAIGSLSDIQLAHELVKIGAQDYLNIETLNEHILERVMLFSIERKHNEERIHKVETNLQSLLESINEGIFGVDAEGICVFANPACVRLLGYSSSNQVLGRNMHQLLKKPGTDKCDHTDKQWPVSITINTGKPMAVENETLWRKDGSCFQAEYQVTPISYNKVNTGAVVHFINIDERKEIEHTLLSSNKELQKLVNDRIASLKNINEQYLAESEFNTALLNTIGALVVVLDTEGRIVRFNHTCERVTDYTSDEVVGSKVWDIFLDPDELMAVKNIFGRLLAGDFPNTFENYWYTRSGNKRLISWSNTAMLDINGNIEYIISSGIDITEKREAEKALYQSENWYHVLANNLPGIVYRTSINGDHKTTYLNNMVYELTGYQPEEIAYGKLCGCDLLVLGEDRKYLSDTIDYSIRENKPYAIEYRIRHKDGGIRYFSDRGRPVSEGKEHPTHLDGVIFDISSQKYSMQREQQRMIELAHVNRIGAMGEMATEIAHELNQPLGSIVTYSDAGIELLKSDPIDVHAVKSALHGISTQANRASEIIKGLRNFVGKQKSYPSTTDMNELISSVIKLSEIEARANNVIIESSLEGPLPVILTEKILIEQVVLNLIRNAIEALSSVTDRERKIIVQATHKNDEILVSIQDTGTGLPLKNPMEAFDPFITTKSSGMGMGLPISKRIIEAHGGKMIIKSNTEHGVTFQFSLPTIT